MHSTRTGRHSASAKPPLALIEVVHAAPRNGLSFLPCCDRMPMELSRADRISLYPSEVTCGRLSAADERLLSGQPIIGEYQNSEQLMYDMAVSVRTMCGPATSLPAAYEKVRLAVTEVVGSRDPREYWSAAMMVRVTARAVELLND